MYVALYVYGAEFQMIPYESEAEAIQEVTEHFDQLIAEKRFDPVEDEGFVFKKTEFNKDMECVFSTRTHEKYSS